MVMTEEQESILPSWLTIKAMRDNGYRNTTYAIAELIDNSVQAGAKNIELLCYDEIVQLEKRERRIIRQIAVADDGRGMPENELKKAVQFGNGSRLNDRSGIGRFGMGLPNSTVSQCKRLDVYTWQNGGIPIHSYLSIDSIEAGKDKVPQPSQKEIERHWKEHSNCLKAESGTLVVWSELDRCNWKKSDTIIRKSESAIGRIYRNLINAQKIKISAISFVANSLERPEKHVIRVNDPGYLMKNSSTPEPYDVIPMFDHYHEEVMECTVNGKKHDIKITFSMAKDRARTGRGGKDGGDESWGKHAKENVGVSLMRADRELELDTNMVTMYDPRERWWGVEVSFPPALDEVFGVTNTKQSATNFARLAKAIVVEEGDYGEDGDPDLIRVIQVIGKHLALLRKRIKKQREGARQPEGEPRYNLEAEGPATVATKKRQDQGHVGDSDVDESVDPTVRKEAMIKTLLEDETMDQKSASEQAEYTIANKLKYKIISGQLPGSTLFDVMPSKGVIIVKLNEDHPGYGNLIEVLQDVPSEGGEIGEFRERLQRANKGLGLLLLSWARLEDEKLGDTKRRVQDIRLDWGRIAEEFLGMNT